MAQSTEAQLCPKHQIPPIRGRLLYVLSSKYFIYLFGCLTGGSWPFHKLVQGFFTKRLTTSCIDGWACFNADRVINITLSILKSPNEPCTRSLELTARLPGGARLVVNLSSLTESAPVDTPAIPPNFRYFEYGIEFSAWTRALDPSVLRPLFGGACETMAIQLLPTLAYVVSEIVSTPLQF